jgi:hypothetical protein
MDVVDERRSKRMIEAFVIAFIHCNGESCVISYPRPGQVYASYKECKAQLPQSPAGNAFDVKTFEGSEIACMEVLAHVAAGEWVALETSNLRKSPAPGADVIGTIKRGTSFQVLGQERKWLSIQTADGARGFLWSDRAKKVHATGTAPDPKGAPVRRPSNLAGANVPQPQASPSDRPQVEALQDTHIAGKRN